MRPKVFRSRCEAAAANCVDLAAVEPSRRFGVDGVLVAEVGRSHVEKPSCKRHGSFWDDRCSELEPLARQLQHSQEKAALLHRQSSVLRATRRHQTAELHTAVVTSRALSGCWSEHVERQFV